MKNPFFEEAMHKLVMKLPEAFQALRKDEEPEDYEVTILGSPTTRIGRLTPQFSEGLTSKNVFDRFGTLYSEYIQSAIRGSGAETNVHLYGISMGASTANKTAQQLVDGGAVTQSLEVSRHEDKPFMRFRADTPVGLLETHPGLINLVRRWVSIPVGFFLRDGLYNLLTSSYVRAAGPGEGKFVTQINAMLKKKDSSIIEYMDDEQKVLKGGVLSGVLGKVVAGLIRGDEFRADIKVDIVRAKKDPLIPSDDFSEHARKERFRIGWKALMVERDWLGNQLKGNWGPLLVPEKTKNIVDVEGVSSSFQSLGQHLVRDPNKTRGGTPSSLGGRKRVTAIDQMHTLNFLRRNELRRMIKAADTYVKLGEGEE